MSSDDTVGVGHSVANLERGELDFDSGSASNEPGVLG